MLPSTEPTDGRLAKPLEGSGRYRQALARSMTLARIGVLSEHLGARAGLESAYVGAIADAMFGAEQYQKLGDAELATVEAALRRRGRRLWPGERWAEIGAEAERAAKARRSLAARSLAREWG
jgi:hypothetical protein